MGRVFDDITPEVAEFVTAQPLFFVATAPTSTDDYVNCSPKGLDTFRVFSPNQVGYLDLTGSGAETIAHLRDNGRITLMFCAFEGQPNIVRIYGRGRYLPWPGDDAAPFRSQFPSLPGARGIVTVAVTRVSTSCGYAVPLLRRERDRSQLIDWANRKGDDGLREYRHQKNAQSIDGLPALDDHA